MEDFSLLDFCCHLLPLGEIHHCHHNHHHHHHHHHPSHLPRIHQSHPQQSDICYVRHTKDNTFWGIFYSVNCHLSFHFSKPSLVKSQRPFNHHSCRTVHKVVSSLPSCEPTVILKRSQYPRFQRIYPYLKMADVLLLV